jgi:hypothetical protein
MIKINKKIRLSAVLLTTLFCLQGFGDNGLQGKILNAINFLKANYNLQPDDYALIVEPEFQKMFLIKNFKIEKSYLISTGQKGLGCEAGSYKTPVGVHEIADKIGQGAPVGTIFVARKSTGKIAKIYTKPVDIKEDFVTTRILRLKGLEKGKNSGKGVDSYSRYIYIHGTPEEGLLGKPVSHGCIRMKNKEVIELFNKVAVGTLVYILSLN